MGLLVFLSRTLPEIVLVQLSWENRIFGNKKKKCRIQQYFLIWKFFFDLELQLQLNLDFNHIYGFVNFIPKKIERAIDYLLYR